MEDRTKIIIAIVVLVIVGLPILGNLAGEKKAEQPAQETAKAPEAEKAPAVSVPPPVPQPAQQEPPPQPQQPQRQQRPQPQRPAGPPPPISVANTAWTLSHPQAGNVTVQFFGNGTALAQSDKFPMQVEGTWQQNGSNVSLTSPMGSITAQVKGDQLIAMGNAARRLR